MPAGRAAAATRSLTASSRIGADRFAEQVDEDEVTGRCGRDPYPLELVTVERLHRDEVQRDTALAAGFGDSPARVVLTAHHVHGRASELTPQSAGAGDQVHVAAAQPPHLTPALPR